MDNILLSLEFASELPGSKRGKKEDIITLYILIFKTETICKFIKKIKRFSGTSLVVQWLRIHLPTQGTWVQYLVGELKSHIRLVAKVMSDSFATPRTVACQAPLSMGISQAGILKWIAISSSRGSNLRLLYCRWILYHWATRSTCCRTVKPMYHNYWTCMLWSHAPQLERSPHAITRYSMHFQERSCMI